MDDKNKDDALSNEDVMALATLLAGERRPDVRDTFYGAITTVAATNMIPDSRQWIAAVDALADILKAMTARERAFIAYEQEKRLAEERRRRDASARVRVGPWYDTDTGRVK